ncbi:IDEAL domain-containing protein [Bacillus smithii]|uniref:IDEAL domain-containing protein n=1 Tax=Bacillus smithii TaxID=1479 RepID=UPI003D23B934
MVGFVEYIWDETVQISKVLRVEGGKVQKIKERPGTYDVRKIELLPSTPSPEDIQAMIDIALDTQDKEWFEELTRRRNKWQKQK